MKLFKLIQVFIQSFFASSFLEWDFKPLIILFWLKPMLAFCPQPKGRGNELLSRLISLKKLKRLDNSFCSLIIVGEVSLPRPLGRG